MGRNERLSKQRGNVASGEQNRRRQSPSDTGLTVSFHQLTSV
jgi:hypothetical protein